MCMSEAESYVDQYGCKMTAAQREQARLGFWVAVYAAGMIALVLVIGAVLA